MNSTFRRSTTVAPAATPRPRPPSETRLTISDAERALVPRVLVVLEHNSSPAAAEGERPPPPPPPPPPVETVVRFLRARNGDAEAAARMLAAALALPPPPQPCPGCLEDHRAHSFYPVGPTARGEPVTYSNYLATDTDPAGNVNHMRYAMDCLFQDTSLHRMTWVMDMHGFGRKHLSPSVARRVLTLFADHYPERLGCAIIYDAPYMFYGLFSAVKVRIHVSTYMLSSLSPSPRHMIHAATAQRKRNPLLFHRSPCCVSSSYILRCP
jgi:hypothetical protein